MSQIRDNGPLRVKGYNFLYGQSYCRCYLPEHTAIANLIRDIRDKQLFVPGFDQHELDSIVMSTSVL